MNSAPFAAFVGNAGPPAYRHGGRDGAIEGRRDQSVALGRLDFFNPLGLEPNFAGLAPASGP